ncbi:MAG: PAS domain S-box protein, partial [Granulosicoccaceae bacterium]
WSEPVISVTGDVLGAFTIFYREPRAPTQSEVEYIQDSARLAGIAIEHKRAEDALSESEARYRLVVQQQTELICRFKPDFTLTFVNDAYCRYFGKTERELTGLDFFTLIPKEAWRSARQHFASFTPERSVQVQQHPVITPDGSQRWQQWTNQAFFDESGKLLEFQAVGTDITELKLAEEKTQELLKQNRQLTQRLFQAQEEERRHLARELHDEFGQWLTVMHLHTRSIIDRCQGRKNDTCESAKVIEESAKRMHESIRNIRRSLRPTLLDEIGLTESLRELVSQWQLQHTNVDCDMVIGDGLDNLGEIISITAYRLVQEALNNVARHAEAGKVLITARLESSGVSPDRLNIVIEDDGKGMDPDQPTNGFGLVGMRERILAVGGEFNIDSSPGKGTCLEILLPLNQQENV